MIKIIKGVRTDLHRSLVSFGFLFAVSGIFIALYISSWSEMCYAKDVLFLFKYSNDFGGFNLLLVLFSVLPYSNSFCSEWNSNYFRYSIIRFGIKPYGISKIIAAVISSSIAIVLGMLIYVCILRFYYPLVYTEATNFEYFSTQTLGGEFLLSGQYYTYFFLYIFLKALAGAQWSLIGLCASAYLPNKFITLFSPFIFYYVMNHFTHTFPVYLRMNKVAAGLCIVGNTFFSMSYAILIMLLMSFVLGSVFVKKMKERVNNA